MQHLEFQVNFDLVCGLCFSTFASDVPKFLRLFTAIPNEDGFLSSASLLFYTWYRGLLFSVPKCVVDFSKRCTEDIKTAVMRLQLTALSNERILFIFSSKM